MKRKMCPLHEYVKKNQKRISCIYCGIVLCFKQTKEISKCKRKHKKDSQPMNAGNGMYGIQMGN